MCRFGSLGGPAVDCRKAFKPGIVGVMSRSGGMTTEICNALTGAGLGESTAISIGGDPVIGSTYAELMPLFEADEDTKAVVIYSEPGGASEAELARWQKENNSRLPIVAFVAGSDLDVAEIREGMKKRVPEYMVPRQVMFLDTLPLSANGKFDRPALVERLKAQGEPA